MAQLDKSRIDILGTGVMLVYGWTSISLLCGGIPTHGMSAQTIVSTIKKGWKKQLITSLYIDVPCSNI